jgi:hypothetical protein
MVNPKSVDFAIIEPYLGSPTEDSTVPKDKQLCIENILTDKEFIDIVCKNEKE